MNRTRVELKCLCWLSSTEVDQGLNRTRVELKYRNVGGVNIKQIGLNRTRVELKLIKTFPTRVDKKV